MRYDTTVSVSHTTALDVSDWGGMPAAILTPEHWVVIRVPGNGSSVWVGDSTVSVGDGFEIAPGDSDRFWLVGEHLYAIAENNDTDVKVMVTSRTS